MNPYQRNVLDFHGVMNQPAPSEATIKDYPFELRAKLILEEALEFTEACGLKLRADLFDGPQLARKKNNDGDVEPNWPEMIDALCDILYVTFGAAVAMGVDLDPFFAEVQRANMAKAGGPVREDGKRLKPPGWTPPDIKGLLDRLRAGVR